MPAEGTINDPGHVIVYLGNSDRSFDASDQTLASNPSSVAVGDFNKDGQDDIAALGSAGDGAARLGNGDGTFGGEHGFSTGNIFGIGSIEVGNFDGNARDDVAAIPGPGGNSVATLLSNSDGTFQAAKTSPLPAAFCCAFDLVSGRFNNDAASDIAVNYAFDPSITIMLARGDGTFEFAGNLAMADRSGRLAVGDIEGQGLVAPTYPGAQGSSGYASVFVGNGDGTFQPHVDVPTGGQLSAALVKDLNGDGTADVAVSDRNAGTVIVALNGSNSQACEVEAKGRIDRTKGSKARFDMDVRAGPSPGGKVRYRDHARKAKLRLESTAITRPPSTPTGLKRPFSVLARSTAACPSTSR